MRYRLNGNYIEIYFDTKPNDRIIETLKICGCAGMAKTDVGAINILTAG